MKKELGEKRIDKHIEKAHDHRKALRKGPTCGGRSTEDEGNQFLTYEQGKAAGRSILRAWVYVRMD
jgi:hypothetical protein